MAKIALHITMRDGRSQQASFDGDSVLLGSGPSAVLRLDDAEVSSIHAVLKVSPEGAVTVIDLGSEGGTTVNGHSVTEPVVVKPGDVVGVGGVRLSLAPAELGRSAAPELEPVTVVKAVEPPARAHALAAEDKTVEAARPPAPPARAPEVKAETHPKESRAAQAHKPNGKPSKKQDLMSTQVIRDRGHKEAKPAGSHIITPEHDLDSAVLATPLEESTRPTAEQRALQILVLWGEHVIDGVQVTEPRDIVIGGRATKKADLRVESDLPAESFTIATNQGGEATIVIPASAKVGLRKGDGTVTRELSLNATDAPFPAKAYRLGLHERLAYKMGTLTVVAQYVRGDARMGRGSGMDWYFPRIFAISALLHIFFVVAAFITPEGSGSLVDDLFKNQNRFAQMILKAQEKEKKSKKLDLSGMKGGAKAKGDEGKFGKKDKPKKDALASKAGAPRVDPNKREKDRKIALNSGLLGILKGSAGGGAVSNVFGPGGLGTGINNAMGGLRGTEMGDAGGAGGLGTRGTGAGGGGNSLGIGGLGTYGHGRGTGGYGNVDLGGRGKGTTRIVPGKTIIQGSLSKEEIGRVIRRNLARFKYCYEKQLQANPNLSGKVSVYFTIAPTGDVADASVRETQMNDENVESCVVKVMRSLKFPKPKGGGIVVVTYPFVFDAA